MYSSLAPVCEAPRCVIDLSTPETLERDFYAWLNGGEQSSLPNSCPGTGGFPSLSEIYSTSPLSSAASSTSSFQTTPTCAPVPAYAPTWHYPAPEYVGLPPPAYSSASSSEEGSPAPSSASSSMASPALGTTQLSSSRSGSFSDADDRVEVVAGRIKASSRFSSSASGRSSGTNQLGRQYSPGLPLSMCDREEIVRLYQNGWKICDISKKLCVTHSCVSKILNRFRTTGSVRPKDAKESRVESPLVAAIRDYRFRLGMTRQSEIREQLIADGICQRDNVPSRSSINHILRTKLDVHKPNKKNKPDDKRQPDLA